MSNRLVRLVLVGIALVLTSGRSFAFDKPGPNPMRGEARPACVVATEGDSRLAIYNLMGERVRTLSTGREPHVRFVEWDGRDDRGRAVPAGVYFAHLQSDRRNARQRIVVLM